MSTTVPPTISETKTTTTDPKKILKEFQKQFQSIYDLQPEVNGSEENIIDFLNSDGDKNPRMNFVNEYQKSLSKNSLKWKESFLILSSLTL